MGAWISATGIEKIAPRAVSKHHNVLHRLYEQTRHLPELQRQMRVEQYLVRWNRWAESLLTVKGYVSDASYIPPAWFAATVPSNPVFRKQISQLW